MRKLSFKPRFRTYRTQNGKCVEVWTCHKPRYYWVVWKDYGIWFEEYVGRQQLKERAKRWVKLMDEKGYCNV